MPLRATRFSPRLVEVSLLIMLSGVVFLSGIVIYALIKGDPGENRIEAKVDAQLDLIQMLVAKGRTAQAAGSCTNFQNQRAIEEAVRDIAVLNGITPGAPRVLPSRATLEACRMSGVPIKDGVPVLGALPK